MEGFPLSRACDLDIGSGHTAYRRASLIDLYLHAKQWRNYERRGEAIASGRLVHGEP